MKSKKKHNNPEILIAEDSPTQAERLRYLLEEHGYEVTTVPNGKQALAAARRRRPALIVSDVMMPEMDGFTLCAEIKRDDELHSVPVILLTTLADARDILKGLECGADNFIRKPYEERYLLTRVDYLLMNNEMRKNQKMHMGVEIYLGGQKHFITAERQQIVDLLISVYEEAVHLSEELKLREAELAHSNQVLQGMYRIAEGLNQMVCERDVAEMALDRTMELPGVQAGWVCLLGDGVNLTLVAARNLPPALSASGLLAGECRCRSQLLSGQLDLAVNFARCELLAKAEIVSGGLHAHATVPLWIGERKLGLMNLIGPRDGLFDAEELKVLHSVGDQVAVALDRARLHEHLEQLVDKRTAALSMEIAERKHAQTRIVRLNRVYAVLSGINTTIVRVGEAQGLFEEACRIAVDKGQFAFAWVGTLDRGTRQVSPVAAAGGGDGDLTQANLSATADSAEFYPLMAEAVARLRPAICNDIITDERTKSFRSEVLKRGYRSVVVLPLVLDAEAVGVFVLYASEPDVFDEEEMQLLNEMAGDISFALDHIRKEEKINYLAYFDAITGLPNRALFRDRVEQRIGAAQIDQKVFGVIMLDLERFSSINESLGRQAGDSLLRQIGQRLRDELDDTYILARLSADYFGIATRHEDEGQDITHVLEKILSVVQKQPFLIGGRELRVSARAGISAFPADGGDIETLLRNAEAARKKAKASGARHLFYAPEFNAQVGAKLTLENKLRLALEREQLVLHYQPKIDLKTGQICGLEALIRWNDPESGLVAPMQFIPLFEETGMILEAGRWALAKAVSDALVWQSIGLSVPRIAVNVSPIQLRQKDFVAMVAQVMGGAGFQTVKLELEITESVIMQDIEANIQTLQAIRKMGVEVAIDDFGTGYSSLSYIAKLPVNSLKIDRAFIMNMSDKPDDLTIVTTIISLAHSLGLRVIAEGVETKEQANLLRLLACDEIQGYLVSPAVPALEIEEFLRERKSLLQ